MLERYLVRLETEVYAESAEEAESKALDAWQSRPVLDVTHEVFHVVRLAPVK